MVTIKDVFIGTSVIANFQTNIFGLKRSVLVGTVTNIDNDRYSIKDDIQGEIYSVPMKYITGWFTSNGELIKAIFDYGEPEKEFDSVTFVNEIKIILEELEELEQQKQNTKSFIDMYTEELKNPCDFQTSVAYKNDYISYGTHQQVFSLLIDDKKMELDAIDLQMIYLKKQIIKMM